MNMEIIADGRTIRISECHGITNEECAGIALEIWQETGPKEEEALGGATSISTEREYRQTGFVDVSAGERLEVR